MNTQLEIKTSQELRMLSRSLTVTGECPYICNQCSFFKQAIHPASVSHVEEAQRGVKKKRPAFPSYHDHALALESFLLHQQESKIDTTENSHSF